MKSRNCKKKGIVSVVNDSLKSVFIGLMGYATFNKTFHVQQENRVEKRVDKENGDSHEGWDSGVRNDGTVHMKRQIGLFGGIAMIIGTMIGSGIFISPTGVFKRVNGSVAMSLIVWIGCGLLSTLSAVTYCELGTVVPRSGGEHSYFQAAFKPLHPFWGQIPSFLFAFITVTLIKPSSLALLSLSFAQYTILPILTGLGVSDEWIKEADYERAHKLLAICCAFMVAFVNFVSAKLSSRVQIVFTVAKMLACLLVIGIGIYNLSVGEFGSIPTDGFDHKDVSYSGIALAFYSGLWSYDGWNNLNFLTEELQNPSRNLPLSILIGLPIATIFYTFMNVSYFTVLTAEELMSDDPVGLRLGDRMLGKFSFIMPILVALSVYGTANGGMFSAGRIAYVAAREGHLAEVLSFVHINRLTPAVAISLNTFLAIFFITFNNITTLLDSISLTSWIFYALSMVAFYILRYKEPNAVRPFRVPFVIPAIAFVVSVYLVLAPVIESPGIEHIYPFIFCGVGVIIYYPFVYKKCTLGFMRGVTSFIQRMILVAPSPYRED